MLQVTNVSKSFNAKSGRVTAINDVTFTAHDGEVVAIIGASGSGKSTLLSMVGLLDSPDSGSIRLDDADVAQLGAAERNRVRAGKIGFVFQQFNLIPNLTALENVELALEFAGWKKSARRERALEMLARVGLDESKVTRRPSHLSGGEQQRVAIARAFATEPELILADEPTGSLDRATGKKIVELLREAATTLKSTVLVVTHDDKVAQQADRRFEIEDGQLREIA
jgi:putative ABC transport system ATP-binding protein